MERSTTQRVGTGVKPRLRMSPGLFGRRRPTLGRVHKQFALRGSLRGIRKPKYRARLAEQQALVQAQRQALDQDLAALLEAEPELRRKFQHLTSVPGIGLTMAIVLVAETNGFSLVTNERQLASYAGRTWCSVRAG